jgi:hypothetical protein
MLPPFEGEILAHPTNMASAETPDRHARCGCIDPEPNLSSMVTKTTVFGMATAR